MAKRREILILMLDTVPSIGMGHGVTADMRSAELWSVRRLKAERSEVDSDVALLLEWPLSGSSEPDYGKSW